MEGLRRRCERHLRGIRLPDPFDLDALCAQVAIRRGRPLRRRAVTGLSAGSPCGLWVSLPTGDYVFYDADTSPLHAEHIVLHELSHILCDHPAGRADDTLTRLLPDLDPELIARVLRRSGYTTTQEREAEMLASLIRIAGSPAPDNPMGRIAGVLGGPP